MCGLSNITIYGKFGIIVRTNFNLLENQNIEWKSKWRDEYLEWICAFANTDGGKFILAKMIKVNLIV